MSVLLKISGFTFNAAALNTSTGGGTSALMAATVVGRKSVVQLLTEEKSSQPRDMTIWPAGLAEQQICVDKDLATGQGGAFAAVVGLETSRKESFARFGELQFQIMRKTNFLNLLLLLVAVVAMPSMALSQTAASWAFLSAWFMSNDPSCSIASLLLPVHIFNVAGLIFAVRCFGVVPQFFLFVLSSRLQCGSSSGRRRGVDIAVFFGLLFREPRAGAGGGTGARAAFLSCIVPRHGGFHKEFSMALGGSDSFFHNKKT